MPPATEIADLLKSRGAALVAYADLASIPAAARLGFPRGISVAVALDARIVSDIAEGPTREYFDEYERANALLDSLAKLGESFLRGLSFEAKGFAATNEGIDPQTHSTALPHKTVATRAGVGWIGKCALLITEPFGSAVRLTTILTDAELPVAQPTNESRCGDCAACVEACPGHAPSGKLWQAGMPRETFFDAFACRKAALDMAAARTGIVHTFCGICIAACPWTKRYLRQQR